MFKQFEPLYQKYYTQHEFEQSIKGHIADQTINEYKNKEKALSLQ